MTTANTNYQDFLNLLDKGFKLPTLHDKYNNVITSNKNKKTCGKVTEVLGKLKQTKSITEFDKLLLSYNRTMSKQYNESYKEVFDTHTNGDELHKYARYAILNPCKLVFNENQNRLGVVVGFSRKCTNNKGYLNLQIVAIDVETGEVVKTTWAVHVVKFLDYATTHKVYNALGLTKWGILKNDSEI